MLSVKCAPAGILLSRLAGPICALCIACPAVLAADANNMAVSTTVIAICKFNTATSTLNFTMNPATTTNATASTTVSYWCTKGTVAATSANTGLHASGGTARMQHTTAPTTSFVPYTLALTGGTQTGQGKTVPLTLTINGTVLNASFINSDVGTYGDTVSITISP